MVQLGAVEVPDGVCGDWRVETFTVSEEQSRRTAIRDTARPGSLVPPGVYKRLMCGDKLVMSNTPMEIMSNIPFIEAAHGVVLINGLGLGMVLTAILQKPDVAQVWVIECAREVIQLVKPTFEHDDRVGIMWADALDFVPPDDVYFDVVYHDIFTDRCGDNYPIIDRLIGNYLFRCQQQLVWGHA